MVSAPGHRIRGLGASLGRRVRDAIEDVGTPGPLAISGHPLFDLEGQMASWGEARAQGFEAVTVLWSSRRAWIVRPAGCSCLRCIQLWCSGGWVGTASVPAATTVEPPPWLLALDSLIAASVAEVAARASSPKGTGRCRLVDAKHGTSADREIWAHPECPDCAGARRRPPSKSEFRRTIGRGPAALAAAPFMPPDWAMPTGPVRRLFRRPSPGLGGATVAEIVVRAEKPTVERGYGRTGRLEQDSATAVLEAIERYLGHSAPPRPEPIIARFDEIAGRAIDPESFILPAPSQFGGEREPAFYRADRPCAWTEAFSVRRGGPVLIPLQMAYYGYQGTRLSGERYVQETSNGCAVGSSLAEAAFYGALEVIERDAFLARWYGRVPARRLAVESIRDPEVLAMLTRLEAEGLGVRILDIRSGIDVPCFAMEIEDQAARFGHHLLYGAGAHPEPERALKAALVEAVSTIRRDRAPASDRDIARARALLEEPNLVQTIDDHVDQGRARGSLDRRFAVAPGVAEASEPLTDSRLPVDRLTSFSRLAAACLGLCEDVLVVDQSRQPFTRRGLYAAKVLAPGLLPMTFGHRNRRVSVQRLERVPGAVGAPMADHFPHMFG